MNIFLDMDGVLTDFVPSVMEFHGHGGYTDEDYPDVGFDVVEAYRQLTGTCISAKEFWDPLGEPFWAYLPKTSWCDELLDYCVGQVGEEHVYLLTSATLSPDCLSGKLIWIQEYLPEWIHRNYIITAHKGLCANGDSLLIDDADKNVQVFRDNGGKAILFPRPWNRLRGISHVEHLNYEFASYFGQPFYADTVKP